MTHRPSSLTPAQARRFLVGHHRLAQPFKKAGPAAVPDLLRALHCIQLDPLDPLGTNADLVALARVEGLKKGEVYSALLPGHAFEHFAKERCLLPAEAFPYYRTRARETPWWRLTERLKRLPNGVVEKVLEEVRRKGPLSARDLDDHGPVQAIDWNGWKGTARAASMALEVLWTRCQVVVSGRQPAKVYDLPRRALPVHGNRSRTGFDRWALLSRVEAAGLLSHNAGPWWSTLTQVRTGDLPKTLVRQGQLETVTVEGSSRRYYAPAGFMDRTHPEPDGRMRLLGPLDPLIWDRALVAQAFGFDYVWEVYKPAAQRRWGWYVCPLLQGDRLVGRLEGRLEEGVLRVHRLWRERSPLDTRALGAMLERHAQACGARGFQPPKGAPSRS